MKKTRVAIIGRAFIRLHQGVVEKALRSLLEGGAGVHFRADLATGEPGDAAADDCNPDFQIANEAFAPNPTVDHNLIDGTQNYSGAINGDDHQTGNPLFADAAGADYHILAGSPAIDSGCSVHAPSDDFDGVTRPQGSGFDIGAFEYGAVVFADGFESGSTVGWSSAVP